MKTDEISIIRKIFPSTSPVILFLNPFFRGKFSSKGGKGARLNDSLDKCSRGMGKAEGRARKFRGN